MAVKKKPALTPQAQALADSLKRAVQHEERRLQRAAKNFVKSEMDAARHEMEEARRNVVLSINRNKKEAMTKALTSMVVAVESSWGINAPLMVEYSYSGDLEAYTDFHSITVRYPDSAQWPDTDDGMRRFVADLKGLSYHEIGHIRFTIPIVHLFDMVRSEGHVCPDVSSCRNAWNVMEDQRMEMAVVRESPVISRYFTVMVLKHILSSVSADDTAYILLIGRRYLPKSVRAEYRSKFVARWGEGVAANAERIIASYMRATTAVTMVKAVAEMKWLLDSLGTGHLRGVDDHGLSRGAKTTESKSPENTADDADETEYGFSVGTDTDTSESEDTTSEGDGISVEDDGSEDGDTEGDSPTGASPSDSDDEGETDSGAAAPPAPSQPSEQADEEDGQGAPAPASSAAEQALNEAIESRDNDSSLTDVIRDYNSAMASGMSALSSIVPRGTQTPDGIAKGEVLADELTRELAMYNVESDPIWQSRTSRGVIDTFQYRTRVSGSRDYHRSLDDRGDLGIDTAVTVILDTSGSMASWQVQLGSTAFACKRACDTLRVPCSVLTFNTGASILWGKDDPAEHYELGTEGGTNPAPALKALPEFRYDKSSQVVILMTDGDFDGTLQSCDNYRDGNVTFILLGLGHDGYHMDRVKRRYGFDHAAAISDLDQVPRILGEFLASIMR